MEKNNSVIYRVGLRFISIPFVFLKIWPRQATIMKNGYGEISYSPDVQSGDYMLPSLESITMHTIQSSGVY